MYKKGIWNKNIHLYFELVFSLFFYQNIFVKEINLQFQIISSTIH